MSLQRYERDEAGPARVSNLMRRRFVSVAPEETLESLFELMRLARIRHVPVVSDGILVGLLSYRDVLESAMDRLLASAQPSAERSLRALLAEQLMRGTTVTVLADETLDEAAKRMLALRVGCLPVVEPTPLGPRLVGLLTESDLLRAAYPSARSSPLG
jgi:CBS domain-containing protein